MGDTRWIIAMDHVCGIGLVGLALAADFKSLLLVDTAFLSQVLSHVKEYRTLLEKLARILRPGGTLPIVDFDKNERVRTNWCTAALYRRIHQLEGLGYTSAKAHIFYHGKKCS